MAKTAFVDGNRQTGTLGTRVLAAFLNLIFNHRHDGLDQDGSAPHNYAAAGGTANALTASFTPALTQHITGMPLNVMVNTGNTGACTIAVNGLTAVALTKKGSTALDSGDLIAGQIITIMWDGTRYQVVGGVADRFRILRGRVASNGSIINGTGFTITHSQTGVYIINITSGGVSSVTAVASPVGSCFYGVQNETADSFQASFANAISGGQEDKEFSFICMIPV